MFQNQRLGEIIQIVGQCHYITVAELAERLYVSQATVRRDVAILEKNGLVSKGYGGISLNAGNNRFVQLEVRAVENQTEKNHIGRMAASLVRPGDALFMDASSTVMSMIPYLSQKNLTVITNSMRVADRMGESGARVYVTGGQLLESSRAFVGGIAERTVRSFHADRLFFSATGVGTDGTIFDYSEMEAQLRQLMIAHSAEQYFLCDSSKFGKSYLFRISNVEHITQTLSDRENVFSNGRRAVASLTKTTADE